MFRYYFIEGSHSADLTQNDILALFSLTSFSWESNSFRFRWSLTRSLRKLWKLTVTGIVVALGYCVHWHFWEPERMALQRMRAPFTTVPSHSVINASLLMCSFSECMEKAWQGKFCPSAKMADCGSITEMLFLIIIVRSDYSTLGNNQIFLLSHHF